MDFQTYLDTRGISKYRLSKLSGVPKTTVMDICSGKSSLKNALQELSGGLQKHFNALWKRLWRLTGMIMRTTRKPDFR